MAQSAPASSVTAPSSASSLSVPAFLRSDKPHLLPPPPLAARAPCKPLAHDSRCALNGLRSFHQAPVRVIRMSEQGVRRGQAGRMVISGRLADVCAELDRLAERETVVH